jgi:hypothetical protein
VSLYTSNLVFYIFEDPDSFYENLVDSIISTLADGVKSILLDKPSNA